MRPRALAGLRFAAFAAFSIMRDLGGNRTELAEHVASGRLAGAAAGSRGATAGAGCSSHPHRPSRLTFHLLSSIRTDMGENAGGWARTHTGSCRKKAPLCDLIAAQKVLDRRATGPNARGSLVCTRMSAQSSPISSAESRNCVLLRAHAHHGTPRAAFK